MKIFLSYASEQKDEAEAIAYSLRSRGHQVFLDRDDLPPGRSYDDQIERAISTSDCMVFLITPQSVERGRYTLTELSHARRRWRKPARRILPVMVEPTPLDKVPGFLKGVTILEPLGNLTAEVSAAVHELGVPQRSVILQTIQAAALALGSFFGIGLLLGLAFAKAVAEPQSEPAITALIIAMVFALPMAIVLATFHAQHSWRALTCILTAIPAVSFVTQDNSVLMGMMSVSETSGPMAKTAFAICFGALTAGLLALAVLAAASFASPEFRSVTRWLITMVVMSVLGGVTMSPFGEVLAVTKSTSEQGTASAILACVWVSAMGGFLGYWLARGEPGLEAEPAQADAASWK